MEFEKDVNKAKDLVLELLYLWDVGEIDEEEFIEAMINLGKEKN